MKHRIRAELADFFYEYDTPRMVLVRDKKVGITFRLIQLGVLVYILGWVFIYEKGYQSQDGLISSVNVKLKGIALIHVPDLGPQLLDSADYVFPPQGDSSFVVMTNFIVTPGQKQGTCAELPDAGLCRNDTDCVGGASSRQGQGVMTGRCIPYNSTTKTCEVFAWCPVENDLIIPKPALLLESENFTLFIKNSISFPSFRVTRRNLVETITSNDLKSCVYDKNKDPLCPVMRLGYIVAESGQQFADLAYKGGTVGIVIDWQCDLDWPLKFCIPTYKFIGLDDAETQVSKGFNFRYARYYMENGTNMRNLYKVFGIRFDIMVSGKAGKFDIIPTMTTIGSGIGIFGVATVVCDLMLLHILPKRNYYKQKKFKFTQQETSPSKEDSELSCSKFQKDNEANVRSESTSSIET
ncbi:P2X purinoceptor 1 isoform X2 [Ambystoma mexicanum]|uniref:P2X purinoceptor 1 isoform X2 n=1 Tax=Ambystoma mexicanum TaxID=8296 RepID=UPI0037E96605